MIEVFSVWCSSDMSACTSVVRIESKKQQQQNWIDTNCSKDLHFTMWSWIDCRFEIISITHKSSPQRGARTEQNLNILINGNIEMSDVSHKMKFYSPRLLRFDTWKWTLNVSLARSSSLSRFSRDRKAANSTHEKKAEKQKSWSEFLLLKWLHFDSDEEIL